ncbi:hypothetical protein DAI22_02g179000 [Oryza sativa Japonica Group]|nr:hypothetical protein DAI22_02g179000 [Oryza sativa Japonica Group]
MHQPAVLPFLPGAVAASLFSLLPVPGAAPLPPPLPRISGTCCWASTRPSPGLEPWHQIFRHFLLRPATGSSLNPIRTLRNSASSTISSRSWRSRTL